MNISNQGGKVLSIIGYKYPEEETILLHYADKMRDGKARSILENRGIKDSREVEALSTFYWRMLDVMADDGGKGVPILEREGIEAWAEYIFHSLNGYFVSNGYEAERDKGQ
ncbi:hypothetical protein [Microbulbifer rhizosphaerae]|uniref:Uncharacterized protein n=1 Tax=Microbulbifer rhizosphaerae TaxID=1562603 RepID=A0A7W4Z991_9GAMM|nr:hypothetical protein [Microbulbifer rhizosphaerae]MBB3061407.1 hypothetical protein [Microbulbifer rhizosphaerae]